MGGGPSHIESTAAPTPLRRTESNSERPGSERNEISYTLTPAKERERKREPTFGASPERIQMTTEERCYDPKDPTLTFAEGDDDMDFECNGYKSLRAKMSCGHTVTPTSLMNWCQWLMEKGKPRFVCGACDAEWSCEEVYKMALMTPEERAHFDKELFENATPQLQSTKRCPGCKNSVMRRNLSELRVSCTVCKAEKGRNYEFCWQCLKEWKGPSPYPDRCADEGCISGRLEELRRCPEINFQNVKNVSGCPSVRACPTCGLLIAHNSKNCKNVTCNRCKVKFCFVCLKPNVECHILNKGSLYGPCFGGVAPRQTTIPVWKKK